MDETNSSAPGLSNKKKLTIGSLALVALLLIAATVVNTLQLQDSASSSDLEDLRTDLDAPAQGDREKLGELVSQVDGLESTIGRLNEQLKELQDGQDAAQYNVDLSVTLLDSSREQLRVESYDYNTYEEEYLPKDVVIAKLSITNDSSFSVYLGTYSIAGATSSGVLVDSVDVHPDDRKGQGLNLELAPNGTAEVYVYVPVDKSGIESLFVRDTDQFIEL